MKVDDEFLVLLLAASVIYGVLLQRHRFACADPDSSCLDPDSSCLDPEPCLSCVDTLRTTDDDADAVVADEEPPEAWSNPVGWRFTNHDRGQKINWYVFEGRGAGVPLSALEAVYFVVTPRSVTSLPWLGVYSRLQGSNDAGTWYHARDNHMAPSALEANQTVLLYYGSDPLHVRADIPHVRLVAPVPTTIEPSDTLLTLCIATNSGADAGDVDLVISEAGLRVAGLEFRRSLH